MLQTDAPATGMFLSPVPEPSGDPAALSSGAARYTAAQGELERDRAVLASVQGQTAVPLQWTGFGAFAFGDATAKVADAFTLVAAACAQAATALRIYAVDLATAQQTAQQANAAVAESNSLATAVLNARATATENQATAEAAAQAAATAEAHAAANPHLPPARLAADTARTTANDAQITASNAWIKVTNLTGQYDTAHSRATTLATQAHTQATTAAAKAAAAFDAVIGRASGQRTQPARGGATGEPGHHSSSIFSDFLHTAGGLALTVVGVGGDLVGFAADETGIGIPLGTALEEISTPLVEEGGDLTISGFASFAGDNAGTVVDGAVAPETVVNSPGELYPQITDLKTGDPLEFPGGDLQRVPTDRLKEHLTERDLDAARRELNGEVVARKPDGTPWDHVDEVRNAQRGLVKRIAQIKRQLGDSRISPSERAALNGELSEASRLLDYSEQYVPRN